MMTPTRALRVQLRAQREQRLSAEAKRDDRTDELARAREQKIQAESKRIDAELSAAATKNFFSQALGDVVQGVVGLAAEAIDVAGDVLESDAVKWVAAGTGVVFGAQLVATGTAVVAALPTVATEGVRWGLTTMSVGKVVDASSNVAALNAGSEANELRKTIESLDEQIASLEADARKNDEGVAEDRRARKKARDGLRRGGDDARRADEAVFAGIRGRGGRITAGHGVTAGARAAQVAHAGAANAEASGLASEAKQLEGEMRDLQARARKLRSAAGDERWSNEKLRTWLDFGTSLVEVAATVLSAGAASAGTTAGTAAAQASAQLTKASLQGASSTLGVVSAGGGIASAFITDGAASEKMIAAERMELGGRRLRREMDLVRVASMEAQFIAEQTLERINEMTEVADRDVLAAGGGAKLRRVQLQRVGNLATELRETARAGYEAAGLAIENKSVAIDRREAGDDRRGSQEVVRQGMAIGSAALALAGAAFSMAEIEPATDGFVDVQRMGAKATAAGFEPEVVEDLQKTVLEVWKQSVEPIQTTASIVGGVGGVASSSGNVGVSLMDDGSEDDAAARAAELDVARAQREVETSIGRLERTRRMHRRSHENAVRLGRNMAPRA